MTLVVVGNNDFTDIIGTKGFGSRGVSKVGAIVQTGRLAYRVAKFAYKRYFGYATKTRSRTIGTATGAGIGIGAGLVAIPQTESVTTPYQDRQTRNYLEQSRSKRFKRCKYPNMDRYPKR